MICINGEMKEGYDEKSLAYMIEQEGFNIRPDRNRDQQQARYISKKQYNETILHSGDSIEVVSFVGGG